MSEKSTRGDSHADDLSPYLTDISHIDWKRIREAGVEHVVIDKDNCITLPHRDAVAPGLSSAWQALTTAGFRTILIVSNSAGSSDDPLAIGAERLARKLGQPVLAHPSKKPAMQCARQVVSMLVEQGRGASGAGSGAGHVAVVGDRITTDIVLASRMAMLLQRRKKDEQAIGILTTRVLEPERLLTRMMRTLEMWTLGRLVRLGVGPGGGWRMRGGQIESGAADWVSLAVREENEERGLTAEESAADEAAAQTPGSTSGRASLTERMRSIPATTVHGLGRAFSATFLFLGQGWQLINDGIRIGTNGRIGSPDASQPRHRNIVLDRLARRPYSLHDALTPPNAAAHDTGSSRVDRRPFSTRTAPPSPLSKGGAAKAGKPRGHTLAYFAALILLPTCWWGGVMLHEWLDTRNGTDVSPEVQAAQDKSKQTRVGPRSAQVPSLANVSSTASNLAPHETQLLRTERLHVARELADINEKLARLQERHAAQPQDRATD